MKGKMMSESEMRKMMSDTKMGKDMHMSYTAKSAYNPEPHLGSGARFKALSKKLASKGATNPGALAAWIGRKKYGAKKFAKLSVMGKKQA